MRATSSLFLAVFWAVGAIPLGASQANAAQSDPDKRPCLEAIAKASGKFVKKKMKAIQKCKDKDLKTPGDCDMVALALTITNLETKLADGIDAKCGTMSTFQLIGLEFPGKCPDPTPLDAFTVADLKDCMLTSHESAVDDLIEIQYGTTTGPLTTDPLNLQREVAKNGGKYLNAKLKAVQKCRNGLNKGTLLGFAAKNCATADLKTMEKVAKAESKARAKILGKCLSDGLAAGLDACNPPATTCMDLADCIIQTHGDAADNPNLAAAADLIDFEYATQPACGDQLINTLDEECDGAEDAACPAMCGLPGGDFPCLCLTKKREHVTEHANADSDSGWTGQSHDQRVVEGAGYIADLYDCDNVSDFDCIVGPNCALLPTQPCVNDAACGGNGPCRKERTATGIHCYKNVQVACTTDAQCPDTPGSDDNRCVYTFHGPPLPLAAGGVSVCVHNYFVEDIVGTVNISTGSGSVRLRQVSETHLGASQTVPCPVCGGFCGSPPGGDRRRCTTNADCASVIGSPPCVTDLICSGGPNVDRECRIDPPIGGNNPLFGTTSSDCPSDTQIVANLDLAFDPATTGTATLLPNEPCNSIQAPNPQCLGGANDGVACSVDSQCPGGFCGAAPFGHQACRSGTDVGKPCQSNADCALGVCSHQCFCPSGGGVLQKPNDCSPACVSTGIDDTDPCDDDSDCPTGFCHFGDCRVNPGDPDGANEGACTAGPLHNTCAAASFRTCNVDADCQPPSCPFCLPTDTCVPGFRQCQVNTGITRVGVPDPTDPTVVAAFCIPATPNPSVNTVSGFPGPGSQRWHQTRVRTGF